MTTLRARLLYPVASPVVEDGMVCVADGAIRSWGRWDGRPAEDLGNVILIPGLINAHCHLDYSVMRGAILPCASFTRWIRRINDLKRTLDDDDWLASVAAGFRELQSSGTTSVFNIEAFPDLMPLMPAPPIRTWWFLEMIDLRHPVEPEEVVARARTFFAERPEWIGGIGLSPHAPYTASPDLCSRSARCCEAHALPLTTHIAESDEESEMFLDASGRLHEFFSAIGRDMSDTGGISPVARMLCDGGLPDGALLAHMNRIEDSDWPLLRGRKFSVIHCPLCHEYFGRPPFPLDRFLAEGINICLGTDSLASNRELNLFAEIRRLLETHPHVAPESAIRFVTTNPARAIGWAGRLGEVSAGAAADLIAIPYSGPAEAAAEAVTRHSGPVAWTMVAGRRLPAVTQETWGQCAYSCTFKNI